VPVVLCSQRPDVRVTSPAFRAPSPWEFDVRFTSPSRRAAGLLAVTTIGLSTAVLSVTGVASADTGVDIRSFTTAAADDHDFDGSVNVYDVYDVDVLTVPVGYCTVGWNIRGSSGGASGLGVPGTVSGISTSVPVEAGQQFFLRPGDNGGDATKGKAAVYADPNDLSVVPAPAVDGTGGSGGDIGGQQGTGSQALGWGGGGGGVSTVSLGDVVTAAVKGGAGGSDDIDHPTGGSGGGEDISPEGSTPFYSTGSHARIDGFLLPCDAPPVTDPEVGNPPAGSAPDTTDPDGDYEEVTGAPVAKWVNGVEGGLDFQLWISTLDSDNPVTGVEYTLDRGLNWQAVATENLDDFQYSGRITGLEAGSTYAVSFRFTTAQGPTAASDTLTGRPDLPGPLDVKAVAGSSSIKVTWAAPPSPDSVAGYLVTASPEGAQSSDGSIECQPAAALGTSCAMAAVPGTTYVLRVHSLDPNGERLGTSAEVTVGPVLASSAVSATLPKADGTLTSSDADGKVVAGEQVTISGKDFLPGSVVDLVVYSTPVKLGTATVLADGTFSATVTLPKDLANGTHHLVASGVDVNGNPRTLIVEVTVSGGTAVLAYTGFSALPYAGAGALALLAGGGLLVVSRRRQAA
jgi:hypothetical protein